MSECVVLWIVSVVDREWWLILTAMMYYKLDIYLRWKFLEHSMM